MTVITTGKFNFTTNTTIKGNFLVEMNCTEGSNYAMAYTEFQNPTWTNKIQRVLNDLASVINYIRTQSEIVFRGLRIRPELQPNY